LQTSPLASRALLDEGEFKMKVRLIAVVALLALSACSKTKEVPKTPENLIPASGKIEDFSRELVATAKYSARFESELMALNFYEPDNCMQVVNLKSKGALIAQVLELSPVTCPTGAPVAIDKVGVQLQVVAKGIGSNSFELRTQAVGINYIVGEMTRSGSAYEVSEVCTGSFSEDTCQMVIENSLFKHLFLY
jgi:hypothetical protein